MDGRSQNVRHALWLSVGSGILWALAFHTGRRLMYQLAYVVSALFVLTFVLAWLQLRWLSLSRSPRVRRLYVGQLLEERLALHNHGLFPKFWLEVQDFSTFPLHRVSRVIVGLRGRRVFRWQVRTLAMMRGVYRLGPARLVSSDPFGLFTFARDVPEQVSILVYPPVFPPADFPLPEGRLSGGAVLRRRAYVMTTNVAGVREYQPGDPHSWIHWPTTARVGRLMSREFEMDPYADVWCVLDMYADAYTGSTWDEEVLASGVGIFQVGRGLPLLPPHSGEYAISAAASVAHYVLDHQRLFGLVTYDDERVVLYPDRGERHKHRILETLALLSIRGRVPLQQVLTLEMGLFPRQSTLVIITGDWTPGWVWGVAELRRRGVFPVVVLVDNATFGPLPSAEQVLPHLARHQIPAFILKRGTEIRWRRYQVARPGHG